MSAPLLIVQFLVPSLDREDRPYSTSIHAMLRAKLEDRFGGWSILAGRPLPGAWRNPETGAVESDESWRYEVGIPRARLAEFDQFLADLARDMGQKAIWRVAISGAEGKAIAASEEIDKM